MSKHRKSRTRLAAAVLALALLLPAIPARAAEVKELEARLKTCEANKDHAHQIAEHARALGLPESCGIIQDAKEIWSRERGKEKALLEELETARMREAFEVKRREYPVAAQVWETLRGRGYSEAATAGILGNMMAECGGHTLALRPCLWVWPYYGLCMWNVNYTPQAADQDVAGQLEVLCGTMRANMGAWNHLLFCNLSSEREAAYYFALWYERCAPASYEARRQNAEIARDYFVGG